MATTVTSNPPYVLKAGTGTATWFLGSLVTEKAHGSQTGGQFSLIEQFMPPGYMTPYHIHRAEDEAFYMLEGTITFVVDGQVRRATVGDFVWGPRDVPHAFRVEGDEPARMLLLATPPAFEQFVKDVGEPALARHYPQNSTPDMDKLTRMCEAYRIELLGHFPAEIVDAAESARK